MTEDKAQDTNKQAQRKKIIIGAFVVIGIVILWQIKSLFSNHSASPPPTPEKPGIVQPVMPTPQPAPLPKPGEAAVSQHEAELMQLQQDTQRRYVEALNELQMLKLSKEIAETTQAIMSAKQATVAAQKNIIDMLTPPAPPKLPPSDYAQNLVNPANSGPQSPPPAVVQAVAPAPVQEKEIYTVVSVSKLQGKWNAVIGYQQDLYSVSTGDVLAPDGSRVSSIDRSGVVLVKNGVRRKVSMVPII